MHPALWEVTGPHGEQGWLFGTIHLLPRKANWHSPPIDGALDKAGVLVLEIAAIDDTTALRKQFEVLAHSPGLAPLSQRINPTLRPALAKALKEAGANEAQFADVETWAAALMLASAGAKDADPGYGIDRALLAATPTLKRGELEGAEVQYQIFDRLPEQDQIDLLAATLKGDDGEADDKDMAKAWGRGDMDFIAAETSRGMLADPELREALFTRRNSEWLPKVEERLRAGERPFVAVGAAHLAGPEGLPALLAARGWKVTRLQ